MTTRISIGWCLLLLATLLFNKCAVAGSRDPRPNVILFVVDDLGWRDLGCYGSQFYDTPHLDRFASQAMRFTQAYSTCHVCSPSRASILTGKYPARLGLTDWLPGRKDYPFQQLKNVVTQPQLPLAEITLAETLQQHGYRTAHIGKWHLGEDPYGPLQQGFDVRIPNWNKGWPKSGHHAPFDLEGLESVRGDYLTDRLTDEAIQFIDTSHGQPFFLYLAHFAVHDPIEGRNDLIKKYQQRKANLAESSAPDFVLEGNPDGEERLSMTERTSLLHAPSWSGFKWLPRRSVKIKCRQDNVQFAAMVEALDQSFGRLMEKLKTAAIVQNTVIVFTSDNGGMSAANFGRPNRVIDPTELDEAYATSNLPLRGGKGWLYEGGIRVPFMIYAPGHHQAGASCDAAVIGTDIYPTVLELLGLPLLPDQHRDGISLMPLLKGKTKLDRPAIYWHFPHYSNHGFQSPGSAVLAGSYKLIEYFENNTVQLFDVSRDLAEEQDLASSEPELVADLRQRLNDWRKSVSASMMESNANHIAAP